MSSLWCHAMCQRCWNAERPGETPISVVGDTEKPCCFCGTPTVAGIYVRRDAASLRCRGEGAVHDD